MPVVDVDVAVAGARTHRSEERQGSKVLAGSPEAGLAPVCGTSATGTLLETALCCLRRGGPISDIRRQALWRDAIRAQRGGRRGSAA